MGNQQRAKNNKNVFQFQADNLFIQLGKEKNYQLFNEMGLSISDQKGKETLEKALDKNLDTILTDKNKIPLEIILQETEFKKQLDFYNIPLPEIFTKLDVTYIRQEEHDEGEAILGKRDALQAIAENKHIVIIGNPGAGKTTLLNYISVIMALILKNKDTDMMTRLEDDSKKEWEFYSYPVNIQIRSFASSQEFINGEGEAKDLINYIVRKIVDRHDYSKDDISYNINKMLEKGMMLIVLDGLDHLPGEIKGVAFDEHKRARDREKLKNILLQFTNDKELKKNRILVTSRSYAYHSDSNWHLGDNFSVAELLPFNKEQIRNYIKYWLKQLDEMRIQDDSGYNGMGEEKIKAYTDDYLQMILSRDHTYQLAKTPLILTFIVSQFGAKLNGQKHYPITRFDLYNNIIEMLVKRWSVYVESDTFQTKKTAPLHERLNIENYKIFEKMLAIIALEAQKNMDDLDDARSANITEESIKNAWGHLKNEYGIEKEPDNELWEEIHTRTGILMPSRSEPQSDGKEIDIFEFPHLSLQEALSAKIILDKTSSFLSIDYWPEKYVKDPEKLRIENLVLGLIELQWERWQVVISLILESLIEDSLSVFRQVISKIIDGTPPIDNPENFRWKGVLILGNFFYEGYVKASKHSVYKRLGEWITLGLENHVYNYEDNISASKYLGVLGDPRIGLPLEDGNIWDPKNIKNKNNFWGKIPTLDVSIGTPSWVKKSSQREWRPQKGYKKSVKGFYVSRYLISNKLFSQFCDSDDYLNKEFWNWSSAAIKWHNEHSNNEIGRAHV